MCHARIAAILAISHRRNLSMVSRPRIILSRSRRSQGVFTSKVGRRSDQI
jgi:hypothetical protein